MKAGYVAVSFIGLAVLCLLAVGGLKFWKFVSGDQQVEYYSTTFISLIDYVDVT